MFLHIAIPFCLDLGQYWGMFVRARDASIFLEYSLEKKEGKNRIKRWTNRGMEM